MDMSDAAHQPALITYDGLPVSAGGAHRIRGRDRQRIWQELQTFMRLFTTYDQPDAVELVLYEDESVDTEFIARARGAAAGKFGRASRRRLVSGAVEVYTDEWRLGPARVDDGLGLIRDLEPFDNHWLGGPLMLRILAHFRLKDPDTGLILAHQGSAAYRDQKADNGLPLGESSLGVYLARPSTCGLFLSLPFAAVTPELIAYVSRLAGYLPFRLSPKHWTRWQLNRAGTRYYRRRVAFPALSSDPRGASGTWRS
jgi:hypothetical protein